jgi:excisionase family DNA binding protein
MRTTKPLYSSLNTVEMFSIHNNSLRRETMTKDLALRKVFTTGEVAEICKVAPRTVSKWFDSGRLKGYRIPGSMDRRIPREHLIAFLDEHGIPKDALEDTDHDPLPTARKAVTILQEQGGEKLINVLASMMKTCCVRCGIQSTCEFAFDAYNVDCEPKIDCLAAK